MILPYWNESTARKIQLEYIATFFAHIGAIRFNKACKENNIESVIMPVPRNLSSSCGTCVKYVNETPEVPGYLTRAAGDGCASNLSDMSNDFAAGNLLVCGYDDEVEQVVMVTAGGYRCLYKDEN